MRNPLETLKEDGDTLQVGFMATVARCARQNVHFRHNIQILPFLRELLEAPWIRLQNHSLAVGIKECKRTDEYSSLNTSVRAMEIGVCTYAESSPSRYSSREIRDFSRLLSGKTIYAVSRTIDSPQIGLTQQIAGRMGGYKNVGGSIVIDGSQRGVIAPECRIYQQSAQGL